ncbi:MAG: beta-galactosidase, partial [Lachnospiraceae bacterium]|nr:beta-galactosidase [Lachnospiraceae bacterium]
YLYRLLIKIYDEEGFLTEAVPYDIGFRKIEIKDKVIYLNGRRLVINGVNRHEWSAEGGRCISLEEMNQDMEIFLKNNINAVRTCHYPDQIPWYYLCDEKGIYMMAETNLETHGSWQKLGQVEPSWNVPGSLPKWREAVLDRAVSNFEMFKNHVSVVFWSLGNESYAGDVLEDMNRYYKEKKDGRLVHYEGVFQNRDYESTISDVESRMYASPEEIRVYLDNQPPKPFILCEYMHDMGNSLGGMGSYIKLLDEYEMYQGGFIWDFIDQALWAEDEMTGQKALRYGGDYDDRPSDYEFSGNGIVFADRQEKPAMQEVKYYYGLYE